MTLGSGPHAPRDDGHLAWGVVVDERYEIVRPVGQGGMGSVYLARDLEFSRQVALKVLTPRYVGRPEREQRFTNEARYGGRVPSHPNIAMTIDAGRMANGRPYIVMEYVEGPAINVLSIIEDRKLELPRLLQLMRGVAEAISAMHRVGVVHRDLTPSNILVATTEGRSVAKVIDFSHAAADVPRLRVGDPRRLTGAHEVPGTPGYMPPEQVRSEPADARMDVFAFGVVLWELLAGKHAFRHLERDEYFELQTSTPTAPPPLEQLRPDLPASLGRLVADCTHVHIAARPSASSVVLRLSEIIAEVEQLQPRSPLAPTMVAEVIDSHVADDTASTSTPDPIEQEDSARGRPGLLVLIVLVAVAAAVAAILLSSWEPQRQDDGAQTEPSASQSQQPGLDRAAAEPEDDDDERSSMGAIDPAEVEVDEPKTEPEVPAVEPQAEEPRLPKPKPDRTHRGPRAKRGTGARTTAERPVAPSAQECQETRDAAQEAKRRIDWKSVLTHTQRRACWSGPERKRLRVVALLELGRYRDCVAESKGSSDPRVVRVGEACEGLL